MRGRLIWGLSLVALGVFFLLQQLGWFGAAQFPFWAFAFALLGVIFLGTFVTDRRQWWALIPGCILLGLTVVMLNGENHFVSDAVASALFLFSIGLPFLLIYLFDRRMWWALIPGGVLCVIALLTFLTGSMGISGNTITALMLFGLAAVFAVLHFALRGNTWMGWATWVAIILAAIGVLVILSGPVAAAVVGPAILIGLGVFLLVRN